MPMRAGGQRFTASEIERQRVQFRFRKRPRTPHTFYPNAPGRANAQNSSTHIPLAPNTHKTPPASSEPIPPRAHASKAHRPPPQTPIIVPPQHTHLSLDRSTRKSRASSFLLLLRLVLSRRPESRASPSAACCWCCCRCRCHYCCHSRSPYRLFRSLCSATQAASSSSLAKRSGRA